MTTQHPARTFSVLSRSLALIAVLLVTMVIVPGPPVVAAPAAADSDPVGIATGDRHSCVLTQEGRVWCWGANDRGQLGRAEPDRSAAPVLVEGLPEVEQLAAGAAHTCAVADDATWCWGANGSGQLGDGTTRDRWEPVRSLAAGVTQLSAGRSHTCGMAARGSHEVQALAVSATGGSYRLGLEGSQTAPISWNAGAPAIQSAFDALSLTWTVEVTAKAGGGYAVEFDSGSYAHQDVPQLTADSRGLRGSDATARISTVTDGGWRLLCWGADSASQLGRGPLEQADLVPGIVEGEPVSGDLTIATDPASGDLYVADSAEKRVWQFREDASFVRSLKLDFEPVAVGAAQVAGASKVFVANGAEDAPDAVSRYDARSGLLEGTYHAAKDPRVVPDGWVCHCLVTAMAVNPADGAVFIVLSGRAGRPPNTSDPFAKLVRVSPDLTGGSVGDPPVDLAAEFPRVKAFTDLAVGADVSGAPVLYALQQALIEDDPSVVTEDWRVSLWDVGGNRLARRAAFPVSPAARAATDGSRDSACPVSATTAPRLEDGTWTRRVRTGTYDFGRIGPAGDGDVGVLTGYGYLEQEQHWVREEQPEEDDDPGNPAVDKGEWTDTEDGPVEVEGLDACVNVFAAGSQGSYGRYRKTLRGSQASGTRLGHAPTDVAAAADGRILVADLQHGRVQQFSAEGEPLTQWRGSQYSAVPTGSHALSYLLTQEGAEPLAVSAGGAHTCVTTSARQAVAAVVCWGADTAGQLAHQAGEPTWIPARDPGLTGSVTGFPVIATDPASDNEVNEVTATIVAAGGAHTCTDGGVQGPGNGTRCWGDGGLGQLGGDPTRDEPLVATPSRPALLAAGDTATCLVLQEAPNEVECWGPSAIQVEGLADVPALDVGGRHACAIRRQDATPGQVLCWGANGWGQTGPLGDGTARAVEVSLRPRVDAAAPTALDAPIVVDFTDETSAVSAASFRLADADGRVVPVGVSCRRASGAPVGCAGGAVRSADLSPRGGIVAGERYGLTVSPDGDLTSGGVPIPPTDFALTGPTALSSRQLGASYSWATQTDKAAYGGSVLVEEARGAALTYAFTGPRVTWYTRRGPTEGLATVLIDGVARQQVDNSATRRSDKVAVTLTGLGKGEHTITIRADGKRGVRATGRAVTVDAFRAGTLAKTPKPPKVSMAWGRSTVDGRAVRRAATTGSQVSFRFRGSQVAWHTLAAANAGRAEIRLDGVVVQRFNGYDDIAEPRPVTLVVPAGPGVHRLTVVATGKGGGSRHHVYVDAFEVSP